MLLVVDRRTDTYPGACVCCIFLLGVSCTIQVVRIINIGNKYLSHCSISLLPRVFLCRDFHRILVLVRLVVVATTIPARRHPLTAYSVWEATEPTRRTSAVPAVSLTW